MNDGGPAFPGFQYTEGYGQVKLIPTGQFEAYAGGMTLRDYFAGQALSGMLASPVCGEGVKHAKKHFTDNGMDATEFENSIEFPAYGNAAYRIADAMLAARKPE